MKVYPLKFKPIFKERIWGGQQLKSAFGKDIPSDVKIGESWELADLPDDKSVIVNGPLAGETIDKVLEKFPRPITGNADYKGPFQLLVKILDAQDNLSVQVHPDRATCEKTCKGDPKTECWYILDAKPGACIYKGLKPGVTKEEFAKAIEDGNCAEYLEKVEVKIGECHFLPSGTAHAIGAGLLIAEIQQPSDTTYRVFDWNRIDSKTGKGRELHVEDSLESIHFDSSEDNLTVANIGRLVDADEFKVDKGHNAKDSQKLISGNEMEVIVVLSGKGVVQANDEEIEDVEFAKGDTFLIPYDFEGVLNFSEETEYLKVTL